MEKSGTPTSVFEANNLDTGEFVIAQATIAQEPIPSAQSGVLKNNGTIENSDLEHLGCAHLRGMRR